MDGWVGETLPLRATVKPRTRASALGAALHPLGLRRLLFPVPRVPACLCVRVCVCVTLGDFPRRPCFGGACAGLATATELCRGTSAPTFSRRPELVDAWW